MTDDDLRGEAEEVRLRLAPKAKNARLIRLTVSALASRMAYSYDEIEDLRIAVGEVCGILLDPGVEPPNSTWPEERDGVDGSGGSDRGRPAGGTEGPPGSIEVVCTVWDSLLRVRTTRSPVGHRNEVSDLNRQILQSVTDEVEFDLAAENPSVTFNKARRS